MVEDDEIDSESKQDLENESHLNLKLLGRVLTYVIIVMVILGLAFLSGIIIWVLRRILMA